MDFTTVVVVFFVTGFFLPVMISDVPARLGLEAGALAWLFVALAL